MFIDLMPGAIREDLLFAPVGHVAEGRAADEVAEGLLVRPFADDEIRAFVADVR